MNRATVGQVALLVAGIGLLVTASSAGSSASGTAISVEHEPQTSVPENASVVEFEELSPETRDAFRRALDDSDGGAFGGGDGDGDARLPRDADAGRLATNDYVRYRGDYHRFSVVSSDAMGSGGTFLLVALGVGAIAVAGLWRRAGSSESSHDGPPPPEP